MTVPGSYGAKRGTEICHETVKLWWGRCSPLFADDIRYQRVSRTGNAYLPRWGVSNARQLGCGPERPTCIA